MTEQTTNEPRNLDELVEWLRDPAQFMVDPYQFARDAADAIEALRARPTLDRDALAESIWSAIDDKGIRGRLYREDCDYLADAILAAMGQDTPSAEQ